MEEGNGRKFFLVTQPTVNVRNGFSFEATVKKGILPGKKIIKRSKRSLNFRKGRECYMQKSSR